MSGVTVHDPPLASARVATGARLARALPLAIPLITFLCAVSAIGPWPVGVFQDDGIYMVLAKALATGEGYRFIQMPGAPNATHYPPLYPAFLAGLWTLWPSFPANVTLFKFANAALLAVASAGTFHMARTRIGLGEPAAAVTTLAFTACAPVLLLTVMVLSEPLFLAALVPVLLASERAASTGRPRDALIAGAAGALLALVRSLGGLAVVATLVLLLWRRRWRAAVACGIAAAAITLPWQLWVTLHAHEVPAVFLGKYGSYFGWLGDAIRTDGLSFLLRVARHNLGMITAQGWASTATDTFPLPIRVVVTLALAALFFGGLARLTRRTPVSAVFLVAYLAVVLIWPFAPARFTWGVWPLIGFCFALGARSVWDWGKPRRATTPQGENPGTVGAHMAAGHRPSGPGSLVWQRLRLTLRYATLAIVVALGSGYATYNWLGVSRGWWTTVQKSVADRARPLAEWALANTSPTAVLATDDDVLIYLYTGRRTIPTGAFTPQEHLVPQTPAFAVSQLRQILDTYRVDYVLASTQYGTYAVKGLVESRPPQLRVVKVLKTGAVFQPIVPSPTDRP